MSKKFVAKKLDLELELTALDGTERNLSPDESIIWNAKYIGIIMQKMRAMELEFTKKDAEEVALTAAALLASELELVYVGEQQYFMENFEVGTLRELVTHVAQTLGGYLKN